VNTPLIAIVVALLVIAAAFSVLGARLKSRDRSLAKRWPLEPKPNVLSERERALYQRLMQSLPGHIILAQVHLRQVLEFQRGRRSQSIANSFNQLSLDFLILNADTSIVAAVELDDTTHSKEHRRRADARKSHALQSAGIPLIRWDAKHLPDTSGIIAALPARTTPERS
jgi:hypothetical protein